jgi:hypothetical protein
VAEAPPPFSLGHELWRNLFLSLNDFVLQLRLSTALGYIVFVFLGMQ